MTRLWRSRWVDVQWPHMETLIFVAFAVPLVTVVAVLGRRRMEASWKEAASVIGLTLRTKRPGGDPILEGAVGSSRIQVDTVERTRPGSKKLTWTRIRASADIPEGLLVGGEGFWQRRNQGKGQRHR